MAVLELIYKTRLTLGDEGWMSIIDDLSDGDLVTGAPEEDEEFDAPAHSGPILEGSRNKTLSHYAGRILKKYMKIISRFVLRQRWR